MGISLVLGANGQDGSYLAERLAADGDRVVGVDLAEGPGPFFPAGGGEYRRLDLSAPEGLAALLEETEPERIFHFSAVHGASGFCYEPVFDQVLAVNTASLHPILEYARKRPERVAVVYASSSKVFGDPLRGDVDEDSPREMTCLYSVSKLAAEGLIRHYRKRHGVAAGILYFFNHESPRRPGNFLFPQLAAHLKHCLADPAHTFEVNTLGFYCDWGSAEEYMDAAARISASAPGEDFVVATGTTWLGRDFVRELWRRHGLDAFRHVREKFPDAPPAPFFQARIDKLRRIVGSAMRCDALALCGKMAGV